MDFNLATGIERYLIPQLAFKGEALFCVLSVSRRFIGEGSRLIHDGMCRIWAFPTRH
jgi:hypothetical protein